MAKPKNPLLSLDAHGSLGGALTFQERHQQAFVRKKPIPRQPNTLAQIYHRWDYQDYARLWHNLSPAQKQQYESDARRSRITGFNLWMRENLNTLPDLMARWHLDERGGSIAYDSSKNGYHGTIFGASPVSGVIDYARYFDGIDDRINCGICPLLDFTTEDFTILAWINPAMEVNDVVLANTSVAWKNGYTLSMVAPDKVRLRQCNATGIRDLTGDGLTQDQWNHLAIVRKQPNQGKVYVNAIDTTTDARTRDIVATNATFYIADLPLLGAAEYKGIIDELRIYNRVLTQEEIRIHYERRYPQ